MSYARTGLALSALGFLLSFPPQASAAVADFEGLTIPDPIPDGYQGFTWGGLFAIASPISGCGFGIGTVDTGAAASPIGGSVRSNRRSVRG